MRQQTIRTAAFLCVFLWGCTGPTEKIVIFHAGSLSALLQEMADRFKENYPRVAIQSESSGSLDVVRKITELGRSCDLIAVADHRVIRRFLMPRVVSSYSIFLGNEMVLATGRSDLFEELTAGPPWYEFLASGRYSYGISDPDRDPAGYFAHLSWKLAETHYDRPAVYRRLLNGLDERWMRPKSSEMVALLQTGSLDFAVLYRSTALQNDLYFLTFPPQVSLGEAAYEHLYSQVFMQIAGDQPGSTYEIAGAHIRSGIALTNPENPWARRFLEFILSEAAEHLYRELGYTPVPVVEVHAKE